jgi:AhpD family alkylhydroperoxidase
VKPLPAAVNPNAPHVYHREGSSLFLHVPEGWDKHRIETFANEEEPLGDALWKFPPVTVENFAPCPDESTNGYHVQLTVEGAVPPETDRHPGRAPVGDSAGMVEQLRRALGLNERPAQPHVDLSNGDGAGLQSLVTAYPRTGNALSTFLQVLMRDDEGLTAPQRELIASTVSLMNGTKYEAASHGAAAEAAAGSLELAKIASQDPKMVALGVLAIAVTMDIRPEPAMVAKAKELGATDKDIHDTVLVAAAINMTNRYVDGLNAVTPVGREYYQDIGKRLVEQGYKS